MKLEKLFESLDEKVFTDELKSELKEQFDAAVIEASKVSEDTINEKVQTLAEVKAVELIEEKIEEKISELEEKADEYKATLDEDAKEKEEKLLDQVDQYLERVVDEFMDEAKSALEKSLKSEKADMIIEAMDAMIVSTGAKILDITEAKEKNDDSIKLAEAIAKYDELIEENIKLEKEKEEMLKMGIIAELKEGLNVIEAEKFDKLAEMVTFEQSSSYVAKLETIKENIGASKTIKIEEKQEKLVEKVEDKKDKKISLATSFSHLV